MRKTWTLLFVLLTSAFLSAGCGDAASDTGASTDRVGNPSIAAGGTATTSGSDLEGTITVSGATSLTDAFTQIADDFSDANPDVDVMLNFESSSTLSTQILEGAPTDVYASADETNMTRLTDESLIAREPATFARNELVIVTKPGNPEGITDLTDLAGAGVISLCGEEVPCGRYAGAALDNAGVTIDESNVTRAQNVGASLTAVVEGDAVAGIVYVTGAASAGHTVEAVSIPSDVNVSATYLIGALEASDNPEVAEAFMAYVLSEAGRAVLAEHGFLPPT